MSQLVIGLNEKPSIEELFKVALGDNREPEMWYYKSKELYKIGDPVYLDYEDMPDISDDLTEADSVLVRSKHFDNGGFCSKRRGAAYWTKDNFVKHAIIFRTGLEQTGIDWFELVPRTQYIDYTVRKHLYKLLERYEAVELYKGPCSSFLFEEQEKDGWWEHEPGSGKIQRQVLRYLIETKETHSWVFYSSLSGLITKPGEALHFLKD